MPYVEKRPWIGFTLLPQDDELHNFTLNNNAGVKSRKPRWWKLLVTVEQEVDLKVKSCELTINMPTRILMGDMVKYLGPEIDQRLEEQGITDHTAIHVRAFIIEK